jgi:lipopolysaccharide transport system ATP-binding protein
VVGHGRTVLFVSHNMAAVRALCQSAMFIDRGAIAYSGEVGTAIEQYLSQGQADQSRPIEFEHSPGKSVQLVSVSMEGDGGVIATSFAHDQPFWACLKVAVRTPVFKAHLEVSILDAELNPLVTTRDVTEEQDSAIARAPGTHTYRVRFPGPGLIPGHYRMRVRAIQRIRTHTWVLDETNAVWPFEIYDNGSVLSRMNIPWSGKVILPIEWHSEEAEQVASS